MTTVVLVGLLVIVMVPGEAVAGEAWVPTSPMGDANGETVCRETNELADAQPWVRIVEDSSEGRVQQAVNHTFENAQSIPPPACADGETVVTVYRCWTAGGTSTCEFKLDMSLTVDGYASCGTLEDFEAMMTLGPTCVTAGSETDRLSSYVRHEIDHTRDEVRRDYEVCVDVQNGEVGLEVGEFQIEKRCARYSVTYTVPSYDDMPNVEPAIPDPEEIAEDTIETAIDHVEAAAEIQCSRTPVACGS